MKNTRYKILNIPIDRVSLEDAVNILDEKLKENNSKPFFVSTVNASFIVKAQNDLHFREILQKETDLNTCDGVSIQMAGDYLINIKGKNFLKNAILGLKIGLIDHFNSTKKYVVFPNRVTGIDLTKHILELSNLRKLNILIVNRPDGLTSKEKTVTFLKLKYPQIKVQFIEITDYRTKLDADYVCDVLFCLLGEGKQEYFISNNKNKIKSSIAIGVGSTFDVLTGSIKPIPEFFKKRGLEWFFRLIYNPNRLKKIIISVCHFPYLVYMSSLKSD